MQEKDNSLSFGKLVAMIVGSTIGGGIFTTAGDMAAAGAHTGSVLVGWGIAGVGMFCLMMCFFGLNRLRPDLTNGIYSYAKEGFGEFLGFNSAWGYWISAILANVSYVTLLFGTLGFFFPIFGKGNNLLSTIAGLAMVWIYYLLVSMGVKSAAGLNVITTISKLIPIFVFLVAVVFVRAFDPAIFMHNFWGNGSMSLLDQIKATNGTTVWCFIGVEGAVVLSARAKKSKDVGKASILGFLGILALYLMVATLSMGIMPAEELAKLDNPQMASILKQAVGTWGMVLIDVGLIISVSGGLLGWTILASDCAYSAAEQGVFMKAFTKKNKNGSPYFSLLVTQLILSFAVLVLYFASSTYYAFSLIAGVMIMVPYLFSAAYYLLICVRKEGMEHMPKSVYIRELVLAILGTIYSVWMLYSAGLSLLLLSMLIYAPGMLVYARGKKEQGKNVFETKKEYVMAICILILAVVSVVLMATGAVDVF